MEGCSRYRSRFPLLEKYERKNSASEFGGKRGSETQRGGYVRTGNPDSASRISSGTFFSVV